MFTVVISRTEFLFCKPLEPTMTARDIFKVILDFCEEHSVKWKKLCEAVGLPIWISSINKTIAPDAIGTHFVIHRQVLAAETL